MKTPMSNTIQTKPEMPKGMTEVTRDEFWAALMAEKLININGNHDNPYFTAFNEVISRKPWGWMTPGWKNPGGEKRFARVAR